MKGDTKLLLYYCNSTRYFIYVNSPSEIRPIIDHHQNLFGHQWVPSQLQYLGFDVARVQNMPFYSKRPLLGFANR